MLNYAFKRILTIIPTLFAIITLTFFLMRIAPGGPFDEERPLAPAVLENIQASYGLNKPLIEQYFIYIGNLLQGDMGPSFVYRDKRVHEVLAEGLPISITLGGTALLLALIIGVFLGSIAALNQNKKTDVFIVTFATFGITTPNYVIAPILTLIFALTFSILPATGWGSPSQMVLPVVSLALPQIAIVTRLMRGSMLEALKSDHIRTARAYGLPITHVVGKHAMRSALLPVLSYLGPAAAALMTGSIVIEQIFNLPGIGRYFVTSALNRDYTMVMGTVIIVATLVLVFNLIVDLLYTVLDPRVRYD
ncbi:MAG: ABC transporter permease subunit [Hellea sp.]|jgi:oligopeptide transport system permease protein|nr:ABC transporter permease subunit [Hellea sp.]MBT3593129.1 ABC transporter permease subunit [Hellea sp.]MBT4996472.1 ABC transporter permease subunit [Hellea sp.]MBT5836072.1 ABC transporter permease subunit [Hellea sp.]MBT7398654.1 ABC transporter permease subunit [Hellea sp.]MDA8887968.1 ABC transporter permease subunit [Hellea sp.]